MLAKWQVTWPGLGKPSGAGTREGVADVSERLRRFIVIFLRTQLQGLRHLHSVAQVHGDTTQEEPEKAT